MQATPSLTDQLIPAIVTVALTVIPAAGALILAWLRQKREAIEGVKRVVAEVEAVGQNDPGMRGEDKRAMALRRLKESQPGLSPKRASQMIEQVLPEVRTHPELAQASSDAAPTLRPPEDPPTLRPGPPLPPRPSPRRQLATFAARPWNRQIS